VNRATGAIPVLIFALFGASAHAEEGMWTFDNPPVKQLQEKYKFTPSQEWLDHVRLSSARLNDGGSGSFVSPHGLLLTNHHVARGQLQKNSTPEHDYIRDGFYAATPNQEMKTPDLEVNVLMSMENVTSRVASALKASMTERDKLAARKRIIAEIEKESMDKTGLRSDVVTLYQGGEYWLYRYKKYTDVRIVFAPEQQIAFFGGDSDNFTYPRYDLDMAIFRVYENGKPIDSKNYLKWNAKGASDGELVFVSGNPGETQRLDTLAQLTHERDLVEPTVLKVLKFRLAVVQAYAAKGAEQAREATTNIFGLQNSIKAYEGRYTGLLDKKVMAKRAKEEHDFRSKVMANSEWKTKYGSAWDEIEAATAKARERFNREYFEMNNSQLYNLAMQIVLYVSEVKKPNGERLKGYHDSELESLRYKLFSKAPIYTGLDEARFVGSLKLSLQELGPDNPVVKTVLNGRTPEQAAHELISGTKLADFDVRKKLIEGGEEAVRASTDPMIVLARQLEPEKREMIKWWEDNIESVYAAAGEKLGEARFLVYGKSLYPDATFTLRLSYGSVKGYPMNGTVAPSKTTLHGLYDRAASFDYKDDWFLPSRWKEGEKKLNLSTPMNFVSTCDIIGGNSGSPVINREGELVGLVFDGNIESLAGDFEYEGERNRTVSVHTGAMIEALQKLYGAQKLANELQGNTD
jgi:hypothetical protein